MTMQGLHGAVAVCETTMQHLHSLFTVCETTVQHLHSAVAVCEMTMQHLHSLFTVCGTTVQGLHSLFIVYEMITQGLHSLFIVYEMITQGLYSLFIVCETTQQAPALSIGERVGALSCQSGTRWISLHRQSLSLQLHAAEDSRATDDDNMARLGAPRGIGALVVKAAEGGLDARFDAPHGGHTQGDATEGAIDVYADFGRFEAGAAQVEVDAAEGAAQHGAAEDGVGEARLRAAEQRVDADKAVRVGAGAGCSRPRLRIGRVGVHAVVFGRGADAAAAAPPDSPSAA